MRGEKSLIITVTDLGQGISDAVLSPVLTFPHTGSSLVSWRGTDASLSVDQTQPNTRTAVLAVLLPTAVVVLARALVLPGVLTVSPAPHVTAVAVVTSEGIGRALPSLPAPHDGLGSPLGSLGHLEEEAGEDGDAQDGHG